MLSFSEINFTAVLVASVVSFLIGAIWYTALFGKVWQKEVGLTEKQLNDTNYLRTYGGSFVCMLIMMVFLAALLKGLGISGSSEWIEGGEIGFFAGLMISATAIGINYLYQFKSLKLFLLDAGYQTLFITIGSIILTLWI